MKIKLIKGWNGNSPGTILEPEIHDVCTQLIRRGIAELVEEKPERKKMKSQESIKEPARVRDE